MRLFLRKLILTFTILNVAVSVQADVIIKGTIVHNVANLDIKNICFEVYQDYISPQVNQSKKILCSVDSKGYFSTTIKGYKNAFYIGTYFVSSTNKEVFALDNQVLHKPFLFEDNDSLNITINLRGKWIQFKGKGSERLNCQFQMESQSISEGGLARVRDLGNKENFYDANALESKLLDQLWVSKLTILQSYKNNFSPYIYNRVYLDSWYYQKYSHLNSLLSTYALTYPIRNKGIIDFVKTKYSNDLQIPEGINPSSEMLGQYIRYLYKSNYLKLIIGKFDLGNLTYNVSMLELFQKIKNNYSGPTRDYLFLTFFLTGGKYQNDTLAFLEEAKKLITLTAVKDELAMWLNRLNTFDKQNFTLTDIDGKTVSLNNLKGKVLVLDFWFLGCSGCLKMSPYLEKVQNYFENRDVVFVSINTDDLPRFKLGLEDGGYTNPNQLLLYTSGLVRQHPLLEYFKIYDFPTLIVIKKNGEAVSSRAPDPRLDNGLALKKMIESAF